MPRKARKSPRPFGAIRKLPSGRYQARIQGPDGPRRTAPTTFATVDAADAWIAGQRADLARGMWRPPELGDIPLRGYLDGWLATRADLAPRTRDLYRRLADRWILPRLKVPPARPGAPERRVELGACHVREITPAAVREWHTAVTAAAAATATVRATHAGRGARLPHPARAWAAANGIDLPATGRIRKAILDGWGADAVPQPAPSVPRSAGRTQAAQAYRLLRTVLGSAVRDGVLVTNPCQVPSGGHVRHDERVPATPAEVQLIAEAMPPRYRAAVLVAAWSGLRAGELFALRRRDVDTSAGNVRVERALVEVGGEPVTFGPPKSEAGRRVVHLPHYVVDALAKHVAVHVPADPDSLVFGTLNGTPLRSTNRSQMFARARLAAGRPDLRWHDLRHTGATLAASTGASLAELQRRLGHSTARAALIYQHASDQRDRELANRLDRLTAVDNVVALRRRS